MKRLLKFVQIISIGLQEQLAYCAAVWFRILTTLVSIVIYYSIWNIIFRDTASVNGFSLAQMVTYVILSQILSSQFSGGINQTLAQWIYDGRIATELLRPVSIIFSLFSQRVSGFIGFFILNALPTAIISVLLFGCLLPAGLVEFALFLLTLLISVVLMFFLEFMVGLVSFYTMNFYGVTFAKNAVFSILSGGVVPLFLFPGWLQGVFVFLPFPYLVSLPVNIYLGAIPVGEALAGILIQLAWTLAMGLLAVLFFKTAVKKVVVQGG
jgi:ABC-2 type transport system permease protein